MNEFEELHNTENLLLRIQRASQLMEEHRRAISRLAIIRGNAIAELRQGQSVQRIADQLGVTRQQVHRLLREALGRGYRPENQDGTGDDPLRRR